MISYKGQIQHYSQKYCTILTSKYKEAGVCSVFDSDVDPEISFSIQEGKGEKLTGANRLLILAKVNGAQERYHNLRILLERLQLENLPGCVLVGDLSIVNVYTGISSHSGKCSCYICEGVASLVSGSLRTFGNLASRYESYMAAGAGGQSLLRYSS